MPEDQQIKVVVVEDEGLIAADLAMRLKAGGYAVPGTADSANQALELIERTSPDLVLMDIRLKGSIDGIQTAEMLRKKLDVPVVYLTAYEDRGTLERASQTHAYGYIKKPIATASLKGAIEIALAKHSYDRELREQRDWAIASFGAVPYAVVVADGFGRISYMNGQAEGLAGWSADRALGREMEEVLRFTAREGGPSLRDHFRISMLQAERVTLPKGSCLKGSKEQIYEVAGHIAPRWRDGRLDGVVIAFTDVTLSLFEEDQLRQESKQEALIRMAEGVMRHLPDLSALADESARLRSSLPPDSPLGGSAQNIERSALDAFAAACHLRNFLEPPQLKCGRVLLNDVLTRFANSVRAIEPDLAVVIDPLPMPVNADEWQLDRAMLNILLHSRNRRRAGTFLVVDVAGAERDRMGLWARIGFTYATAEEDAAALEKIFEPSWSGVSEDLHITHRLVKSMGGLVSAWLDGTDLVHLEIYLPRVEAAAAGVPPANDEPAILLVERDPEIRRILHIHFEEHGYNLLEADTVDEALTLVELYHGPIPLVLANLPRGHLGAMALAEGLAAVDPAIELRILDDYKVQDKTARHLTKWDLLQWAKEATGPAASVACQV